ncbi:MAG: VOC family protein [Planctomycetota bacterium]
MTDASPVITGVKMISVYAVDFEASLAFYRDTLGLADITPMGPKAALIHLGTGSDDERTGMMLIGGNTPPPADWNDGKPARTTFAFEVASVRAVFDRLKAADVRLEADEPMDMGDDHAWFVAFDPSGLRVEFHGRA